MFSILITFAVFWPLLQAGGIMGKMMHSLPVVVMLVLAASLVESAFVLPAHLARSKATGRAADPAKAKPNVVARGLKRFANGPYRRWRYLTIASAVAQVTMRQGYASIKRAQRQRVVTVSTDVDEKTANANEIRQNLEKNYLPRLKSKYPNLRNTMEGEGRSRNESLQDVFNSLGIVSENKTVSLLCDRIRIPSNTK